MPFMAVESADVERGEQAAVGRSYHALPGAAVALVEIGVSYREALGLFRMAYLDEAMRRCKGNQSAVAKLTGLHRNHVHAYLKRAGLLSKWKDARRAERIRERERRKRARKAGAATGGA